jgi:dTDP-4-amino-4,6-dideoxygalactose transaminase
VPTGTPAERPIPVADANLDQREIDAVVEVLRGRWLSVGPVTAAFEAEFAAAFGTTAAVAVSSGTAALHLAFAALTIGPGDEVVMPTLTFVAGAAMVAALGARPVFCDSRSIDDLTLDPEDAAAQITARTKAVVAMHYAGHPADMAALTRIAANRGVALVEDAAHAVAVDHPLGMLGTIGDVGCFSFFATKNLACGEGGMVLAQRPAILDRIRLLRSHHSTTSTWGRHLAGHSEYDVTGVGYNYRPTEVSSAIGRVQLTKLADDHEHRTRVVQRYRSGLAGTGLGLPFAGSPARSGHHLFVVVLPAGTDRRRFVERMRSAGVQTSVHYRPTHRLSHYRASFPTHRPLPVSESLESRIVSLPLHARLTDAEVDRVIAATRMALGADA